MVQKSSFLRGEIGATSALGRDIKSKILFVKHSLEEDRNKIVRNIMDKELVNGKAPWFKKVRDYLNLIEMDKNSIMTKSKKEINLLVQQWDKKQWEIQMKGKVTLDIYRKYKADVIQEKWFKNGYRYEIMMRARSNTLKLTWREKKEEDKLCKLCRKENETLKHFVLECTLLQNIRNLVTLLQKPRIEREEEVMKEFLLFNNPCNERVQIYIDVLYKMFCVREKLVKILI